MKIFLGWSGDLSNQVATALREWLPYIINELEPYMSEEDIEKGARWSAELAKELDESSFGIMCLTPENIGKPWINFEAGALSKSMEAGRVSPFLFGVKPSQIGGPLSQFQTTSYKEQDLKRLLYSLNNALDDRKLDEKRIDEAFKVWWPRLKEKLEPLLQMIPKDSVHMSGSIAEVDRSQANEVLEQILSIVRDQQRILNSPEALLPKEYLAQFTSQTTARIGMPKHLRVMLHEYSAELKNLTRRLRQDKNPYAVALEQSTEQIFAVIVEILGILSPSYSRDFIRQVIESPDSDEKQERVF